MKIPYLAQVFASALVLAVTLGTVSVATARSGPATASVTGTVQTIDVAKNKITIKTGVGTSVNLAVGRSTAITRNGAPSLLRDLTLNDSVTGQYKVSSLAATRLTASGPAVTSAVGKATSISFARGVLSIGSTNLHTTANTRISRNGKMVSLRQITLRDALVAHAASGTNVALDVVASGPPEAEVHGVITDITGSTVTITPDDGVSPPVPTVVGIATLIEVNDQPGVLLDLQTGQTAEAEYDPITFVAFSIEVVSEGEDAEVEGIVASVDLLLGTVTIRPLGGGLDITLFVNASTEIDVNDAHAALTDIEVGMPIKAEYGAGTLLATQIEAGVESDD